MVWDKSSLQSVWRRVRYFFEPSGQSNADPILTYRVVGELIGKTVPKSVLEEAGQRVSPERARVLDLLSTTACLYAGRGSREKGILDPETVERDNLAPLLDVSVEQVVREARAHLMSPGSYRKGRRTIRPEVLWSSQGVCHILWQCSDVSTVIRFSIVSRWEFWVRVRLLRLFGWEEIPQPSNGGSEQSPRPQEDSQSAGMSG